MANAQNGKGGKSIGMGTAAAGIGAALAAAAGAYWLYGAKDAAKHRKLAKSWMLKASPEVARLTRDLRGAWAHMSTQMKSTSHGRKLSVQKASPKKSAKKSAKK